MGSEAVVCVPVAIRRNPWMGSGALVLTAVSTCWTPAGKSLWLCRAGKFLKPVGDGTFLWQGLRAPTTKGARLVLLVGNGSWDGGWSRPPWSCPTAALCSGDAGKAWSISTLGETGIVNRKTLTALFLSDFCL